MKKITQYISSGVLAATTVAAVALAVVPATANAADCTGAACAKTGAETAKTGGKNSSDLPTAIKTVVNILLFVVGTVAVIMIVIGGVKYTTSNGDSTRVTAAKNTILYSVIGVVVAIMAYALVDFVVDSFI